MSRLRSVFIVPAILVALAGMPARGADRLVLQLGWLAEPESGGFLQARETGLYEKSGIDLAVKLGSPQANTMQLLLMGRADFILAPSTDALNAARAGFPVVVVAAVFQRDPYVIIAHKGAGNDTLQSMRGKPIMIAPADRVTFWPFLRSRFGFSDEQIRPYASNSGPFMADKYAIQQGYVTSEPFGLKKLGADVNVILLSDQGYDNYGETLITTRDMVSKSPDLVQRFVDASIRGWYAYLYGDPVAANRYIKRNNPEMGDDQIAYSIAKMKEVGLVDSGETKSNGIGAMSDARWRRMAGQMISLGSYPAGVNYRSVYTLQFVNKRVGM